MKSKAICVVLLISATLAPCINAQQDDFPVLTGPYLGQKPPGTTPEIFAPGIISTSEHEYCISFSTDLNEIYLKRKSGAKGKNLVLCFENNKWSEPREVPFEDEGNYGEIHLSPDGKHLLANHITAGPDGNPISTIKKFTMAMGRWSDPITVGPGMRATCTEKGNVYVTQVLDWHSSLGAIGYYRYVDGNYEKIEGLGSEINIEDISSTHPFIDPDEKYLIFNSNKPNPKGS